MSAEDPPQNDDAPAAKIEPIRIDDEMEQSYIDYAMSVIVGRSIPDARDGLKPVQRRVLYAMNEDGVTSNSSHRKSSSIVGDTMGDYHPHGDSSIYDALVRMAQDFSLRHPLVDGQGNFGSIDDDPPAAMRYTEARLSPLGEELMEDLGRDTVSYQSNYDDRLEEPEVLPAKFPNLLVNGASGIAVGLSTNIPPHNLGEIVDATIHLIDNPDADVDELMNHLPGPDFPTGGTIGGREGIYNAYSTGQGRIRMRADYHVEEREKGADRIVITELPFQEKKSRLVERIANMVNEDRIEGVSDLRDESDSGGVRVVIDLKRGAVTEVVENTLLNEVLEKTFGVQMLAIVDGQPQMLTLKQALGQFIEHRKTIVRRRSEDELEEREHRAHILEGRLKALDYAEQIVDLIRDSEDRETAIDGLIDTFDFTERQATHIVRMQLGSLTSMEAQEIEQEYDNVTARIERLQEILNNEEELLEVIKDELEEIKQSYADERRTNITEDAATPTREDLITEKDLVIILTEKGYIKAIDVDQFRSQHRGGKGIIGTELTEDDRVAGVECVNTHESILCLTSEGDVHSLKGYELPEQGRTARGDADVNVFNGFDDGEHVTAMMPLPENVEDAYLTLVTRNGYIKRTHVNEFENILSTGIRAIGLDDGDEVIDATLTDDTDTVLLSTSDGRAIRFPTTDVRPTGRSSKGVMGVELNDDEEVVGLARHSADDDPDTVLTVTRNGYGKRTSVSEYSTQSRYGKGLVDIETEGRNGASVSFDAVSPADEIVVATERGQVLRTSADDISVVGRNTKGVKVMDLATGDSVVEVSIYGASTDDESDSEEQTGNEEGGEDGGRSGETEDQS